MQLWRWFIRWATQSRRWPMWKHEALSKATTESEWFLAFRIKLIVCPSKWLNNCEFTITFVFFPSFTISRFSWQSLMLLDGGPFWRLEDEFFFVSYYRKNNFYPSLPPWIGWWCDCRTLWAKMTILESILVNWSPTEKQISGGKSMILQTRHSSSTWMIR